jgi:hypothetical protein
MAVEKNLSPKLNPTRGTNSHFTDHQMMLLFTNNTENANSSVDDLGETDLIATINQVNQRRTSVKELLLAL